MRASFNRIGTELLVVDPSDGWNITVEYLGGATTLSDPTGEFAGFPARSQSLADKRRFGAPDNDPERLLTRLVDEHSAIAAAHDRYGRKPDEEESAGFDQRQRQTVMLGSLVIRHPGATAAELSEAVLDRYVYPQQDAVAEGIPITHLLDEVIATATAGQELYDQLAAMTR
jgi:hypothetical protein